MRKRAYECDKSYLIHLLGSVSLFVFANKSKINKTKLLLLRIKKTKYNVGRLLLRRRELHQHFLFLIRSLLFSNYRLVLFFVLFALISFVYIKLYLFVLMLLLF
jgi:hypothetical protein